MEAAEVSNACCDHGGPGPWKQKRQLRCTVEWNLETGEKTANVFNPKWKNNHETFQGTEEKDAVWKTLTGDIRQTIRGKHAKQKWNKWEIKPWKGSWQLKTDKGKKN